MHLFKINDRVTLNGELVRIIDIGDPAEDDGFDITPITVRRPAKDAADERDEVYPAHELDAAISIGGGFKVGDIFTRADGTSARITAVRALNYRVLMVDGDSVETAVPMTHDELIAWHLAQPSGLLMKRITAALKDIPHKDFQIVDGGIVVVNFVSPINGQLKNLQSRIIAAGLLHPRIDPANASALLCEYPYGWSLEADAPYAPRPEGEGQGVRVADEALAATALEIRRLQQRIADLESQLARANERTAVAADEVEAQRERADIYAERLQVANNLLADTVAPKCKEVCTLMQSLDSFRPENQAREDQRLAEKLNAGWEILDIAVTVHLDGKDAMHDRIVTLTREVPAPEQERSVQMLTVVPNTAVTIQPVAASPFIHSYPVGIHHG